MTPPPLDVCVLGRIGYDLYAIEHNRPLGEVEHFSRHLGGSSANTAVGLARLGLRVAIISAIGKDLLASYLLDFLKREKINTSCVRLVEGYNTSLCLSEVSPPHNFSQVFYRSNPADMQVVVGDAEREQIKRAGMFVTNGTTLAASPSRESAMEALKTARSAGLRTVFDVDYRANSWPSPEAAGRLAHTVLPLADVVFANEEELAILTGKTDCKSQVAAVLDSGVNLLIRKLGPRGVEAHTHTEFFSAGPFPMPVTCAIGGGDGFASGFLYALYKGHPLAECLRYGNAAAAVVVSRVSCSDAMPRLDELEEVMNSAAGTAAV
ncbi:MAG TPA: 5-dehydro-2-deoxygluconokinase [Terriglobales bacterium]|nr:5-dehydro-2-deoxygluconokinase [Terriglobales bacterium]